MFENEKAYIENYIKHLREAVSFFSNPGKADRELKVVRAFLRSIGEAFSEDEIVVGGSEPIDVSYRTARFQVREIVGDRKRMDEFRTRLDRAMKARRIRDLIEPWASSKEMSPEELGQRVAYALASKSRRYGHALCSELDALVYMNPGGRHLWPVLAPSSETLSATLDQNWRSVSLLFPPYGSVFVARSNAPDFLKAKAGQTLKCEGDCFD